MDELQLFARKKQYVMMLILVCASTAGVFALMAVLAFVELPKDNKDIFANTLMVVVTAWVGIAAYFFSTSVSSANKDDKPLPKKEF